MVYITYISAELVAHSAEWAITASSSLSLPDQLQRNHTAVWAYPSDREGRICRENRLFYPSADRRVYINLISDTLCISACKSDPTRRLALFINPNLPYCPQLKERSSGLGTRLGYIPERRLPSVSFYLRNLRFRLTDFPWLILPRDKSRYFAIRPRLFKIIEQNNHEL
jgi:hypothetical protein